MKNFKKLIGDMTALFAELSGIANVKLDAAKDNHVATLEECMKKEQSLILKLKGFEVKREAMQEELGFKGYTFKDILEKLDGQEKKEFAVLFELLSREIQMFQNVNANLETMIKVNLREIKKGIERSEGIDYGNPQPENGGRITDRSV